ncbi:glycine hydroxymethyltransferase [Enterococcus sp. DIV0840]|uniref:hypothetical protein n=1 Tax=Enterococcus TaxID=1350 RepID=UPI001A8C0BD5|nr:MULTISPECIES: hypothetical protein [Enterococcus]MBO0433765.1 hypothetical protein [Enterococcus sp. DIV0849a]MBO0474232.1 hypothetical protein [Enterococcus ureasiticus]
MLNKIEGYTVYKEIEKQFNSVKKKTLPLCAAENLISPFAKLPLGGDFQERYIMNGVLNYEADSNFIGSSFLFDIYELINTQCAKIFDSTYADARTLTGMNCVTSLLMSITKNGDKIMVSDSECGGHQSMKIVCKRLGLQIIDMPYDYDNFDLDYEKVYSILKNDNINFLLYAPSDIINPPNLDKLKLPQNTVFLYDASQTLGLIAGKQIDNPLHKVDNCILFGGTHKTLPGPANGLIMTKNDNWAKLIDKTISPLYIRHTQMHQIISLLYTLFEMEAFGVEYSKNIVDYAQKLSYALKMRNFDIPSINGISTFTHQIFIRTSEIDMNHMYSNAFKHNITLDKKSKKLFQNHGIRLGTQEIARLHWQSNPIDLIANIIESLNSHQNETEELLKLLAIPEDIQFTFKKEEAFL